MAKRNGTQVIPLNVSVRHDQRATVASYAKDNGLVTLSEAVRHIIDEWTQLKAAQNGIKLSES